MIPDQSHSTKSMVLAVDELRHSLTEAITTANLRFIESGSAGPAAAILLGATMTATNSPFCIFHELPPFPSRFPGIPFTDRQRPKMGAMGRLNFIMKPYKPA